MALRAFFNEIRTMKVNEIPGYVKPMLTINNLKSSVARGLGKYNDKYIQTGSVDPLLHVCFGGLAFSYLVALPEERRHLAHKQHGGGH